MLYIIKSAEPVLLQNHKSKPYATYENLNADAKKQIRETMLSDQGHLCAYCMRRIELNSMKIEHYVSQNPPNAKQLDYANMLGVCKGDLGSGSQNKICDTHRSIKNEKLSINPLDDAHIKTIKYKSDGAIESEDAATNYDLSQTLNLNHPILKDNRKKVATTFRTKLLELMPKKGNWNKERLHKLREQYVSQSSSMLEEYVGVILYLINKKL